jgi:chromosome partitioning protein
MLTILVASSKGGCGKSTLTTNLAAYFSEHKKNTVIVDTDRQRSSYRWCEKRPDGVPGVLAIDGTRKGWANEIPPDADRVIVDTAAGIHAEEVGAFLDVVNALIVPVLPSVFDLETTEVFCAEIAALPRIKKGKVPVAIIANRLKPWTNNSQAALERIKALPFPVVAELRDSMGYVVLTGLGKSIFDYGSENVISHQQDWQPLLKWLKKLD